LATGGALAVDADAQERPATVEPPRLSDAAPNSSVVVQVTSDTPETTLARFDYLGSGPRGGFYEVSRICTAPCSATVPDTGQYRVVGPRMTPSSAFTLPCSRDPVDVGVHAGSWRQYAAGLTFSILGAAYAPTGAVFLATSEDPRVRSSFLPLGATFLSVGVAALAVGLPLWLGNRTRVDVQRAIALGPSGLVFR
jgi:hypothetical protein